MYRKLSDEELNALMPDFTIKMALWILEQKVNPTLVFYCMLNVIILYLEDQGWDKKKFLAFMDHCWESMDE